MLFKSTIETILVGDPRQVTYKTNHYRKYPKYKDGKIKEFIQNECKSSIDENTIDEETLKASHRNNKAICNYSSKLHDGEYEFSAPCDCETCRNHGGVKHEGVFLVRKNELSGYLDLYNPVQLRYNKGEECDENYSILNFGQSKGKTYSRVIIYPTKDILTWIKDNTKELKPTTKSRFYVALTRARHSVAIVYDYVNNDNIPGTIKYKPE